VLRANYRFGGWWAFYGLAAGWVPFAVAGWVALAVDRDPGLSGFMAGLGWALLATVVFGGFSLGCWELARCRATTDSHGIIVRNPFRRARRVPWGEINSFEFRQVWIFDRAEASTAEGSVPVFAVQRNRFMHVGPDTGPGEERVASLNSLLAEP
jgi:hypothetical protein